MERVPDVLTVDTKLVHMVDQTNQFKYHVFEDDELLTAMDIKRLLVLTHGPNIAAELFDAHTLNIRTGDIMRNGHHCGYKFEGDHARITQCFFELHLGFCPCWVFNKEINGWVRCGWMSEVVSPGCTKHKNDEMRKVFDKIRKNQPVYGRDLNNPFLENPGETAPTTPTVDELAREAEEIIETQLEKEGKVNDDVYVHSTINDSRKEKERLENYKRKDTKEIARAQKDGTHLPAPAVQGDVAPQNFPGLLGPGNVRFDPSIAVPVRGDGIPELNEKLKNGGKGKLGKKIAKHWGGNKRVGERQEVTDQKENVAPDGEMSRTENPAPGGHEKKSRLERACASLGVSIKKKEKSRGGSKQK